MALCSFGGTSKKGYDKDASFWCGWALLEEVVMPLPNPGEHNARCGLSNHRENGTSRPYALNTAWKCLEGEVGAGELSHELSLEAYIFFG